MPTATRRIRQIEYTLRKKPIAYFRIEVFRRRGNRNYWDGEINFSDRHQLVAYINGQIREHRMLVKSFNPGSVIPLDGGKWSYTIILNGMEFRPGSAREYVRSGTAKTAMHADVALARLQYKLVTSVTSAPTQSAIVQQGS